MMLIGIILTEVGELHMTGGPPDGVRDFQNGGIRSCEQKCIVGEL